MISRAITSRLRLVLEERPAALLVGPRQAGKSTLAKSLINRSWPAEYVTFDRIDALTTAKADLHGFLDTQGRPLILDEVQRVPEIFLPIKAAIDEDRRAGSYLLTGSANVMLLPKVSDSLVGRLSIMRLFTLTQSEINQTKGNFIERLFSGELSVTEGISKDDLIQLITRGGFPEVLGFDSEPSRIEWFADYIDTLIQRDLRDISDIASLDDMPRLLSMLAARAGGLLNTASIGRDTGIAYNTLKRYLALFDLIFLTFRLPAYKRNLNKRAVKSAKVFFLDSGVACYLAKMTSKSLADDDPAFGRALESFVVSELYKLAATSDTQPSLMHYRTDSGSEVDLVMESRDGGIAGVEVKATMSPSIHDARGLIELRDGLGDLFRAGVILHPGSRPLRISDRISAMPVSALWSA